MSLLRARLSLFSAFLFAACAVGGIISAPAQAAGISDADIGRNILVMLRLPGQHYRPNSSYGSGYGDDIARNARRRAAERIAHAHRLKLIDNWPMPIIGVDCFVMTVLDDRTSVEAAEQVSKELGVSWSQPLQLYYAQGTPAPLHDPLLRAQPAATQWRLADLRQLATGRGVRVAIIDSRIDTAHPDLRGQVVIDQDFAPNRPSGPERHGTGVAGVIAAIANNGVGIMGVAPGAKLMGLRACWQTGADDRADTVCNTLSLAKALQFAITHDAQIVNMSISGPRDPLLARLLEIGMARRMTFVAAFDPARPGGGFPASHPGVIAVSADSLASVPPGVYVAPGQDIPTTLPGGRWYLARGSSFSAAHVSGLAALLRESGRASLISTSFVSSRIGGGTIDTCATLVRFHPPCDCACFTSITGRGQ